MIRPLLCVFSVCLLPVRIFAAEPADREIEFFERSVRPLLVEQCFSCHSRRADRLEAGLLLDNRSGILKGGDSGAAVVPGKPDESLLIEAVRYESFEMPPQGRLPKEQVDTLVRWVEMGAPWPAGDEPEPASESGGFDWRQRQSEHWAWAPIRADSPPVVQDEDWPRGAIDRFLLAGLEQQGLHPAPVAERRTLVRRLYFDLIGLPPTPEQVAPTAVWAAANCKAYSARPHSPSPIGISTTG